MNEMDEIFSPQALHGIKLILTAAGYKENVDFFFSNGLCFYDTRTQFAQMDAIAEYLKNVCDPEDLE